MLAWVIYHSVDFKKMVVCFYCKGLVIIETRKESIDHN